MVLRESNTPHRENATHAGRRYQLASKTGTLDKFLQSSGYGDQFKGMKPGSPEFNAQWQKIARDDTSFGGKQHDFIKATHYDPAAAALKKQGIDIDSAGSSVKDALWSTSVQFGAGDEKSTNGAVPIFKKAFAGKDFAKMSDEQRVNAIQDYKAANNEKLFASSSAGTRTSTAERAENERSSLLALAKSQTNAPTQIAGVQRITPVSTPSWVPERLPPVEAVSIPTLPERGKDQPVRIVMREPIGQASATVTSPTSSAAD